MRYFKPGEIIPCGVSHLGSISPTTLVEVFYGGDECFVASFECDAKHFNVYAHHCGVKAVRVDLGGGNFCIRHEGEPTIELWLMPTGDTCHREGPVEYEERKRTHLLIGAGIAAGYEVAHIWNDKWGVMVLFARRMCQ